MSWSSLPDEMVSLILGKLSLIELAPITTTCSSFHAFYRERMAREQELCHRLAVYEFGAERIACLCVLIVHLLKEEPLRPPLVNYVMNQYWISGDGVLRERGSSPPDIAVTVQLYRRIVRLRALYWGLEWLTIDINHESKHALIDVKGDENPMPAALLQALLSGRLARCICDVGFQTEVSIAPSGVRIAPLLPFASRYIPVKTTWSGCVRAHMLIGVAAEYGLDLRF